MKKLLLGIIMLVMIGGCTGINTSVPVDMATDVAFVLILQNNPSYKPAVVAGLNSIKAALDGELTYDDLMVLIAKALDGKYAVVAVVLMSYLDTDKPIFESWIPMLDSYKQAVIAKIDRFILLTDLIE